jgi:hypothetical protein
MGAEWRQLQEQEEQQQFEPIPINDESLSEHEKKLRELEAILWSQEA